MPTTARGNMLRLILSLLTVSLFLASVSAQALPTLGSGVTTNNDVPSATSPPAPTETTDAETTAETTGESRTDEETKTDSASPTDNNESTDSATRTSSGVTITNSGSTGPTSGSSIPSISSITNPGGSGLTLPTNLPTIAGQYSYPPPSVPPTANAPFMQHSSLPEGTVFIVVGASLGFLGATVLAWRGLVAWSLHRSVKRAAMAQNLSEKKPMLRPPGGGFYSNRGARSSLSLDHLAPSNRKSSAGGGRGVTPRSSLFFSPTARGSMGMESPGHRGSGYLPAGYYAAGNAAPGGGAGMANLGGTSIGLTNLGPQSQGYSRARNMGPSPPGSPSIPPTRGHEHGHRATGSHLPSQGSTSTLNLTAPSQGRAPSAYLEDLFEHHQTHPGTREMF
ncbi:MAG: hypothetical protein M1817_001816 [Caeruleum heppii]|nr:MAG: hypothetical protein M1817_001816 [Caeruleum heppii]